MFDRIESYDQRRDANFVVKRFVDASKNLKVEGVDSERFKYIEISGVGQGCANFSQSVVRSSESPYSLIYLANKTP